MTPSVDPVGMLRPRRAIRGMSAVLLPYREDGEIDWDAFRSHVARTAEAGLTPAVNMDTGYVNLLTPEQRRQVLTVTRDVLHGAEFVAGAFVDDEPGARFDLDGYRRATDAITAVEAIPVVFPSYGLSSLDGPGWVDAHARIGDHAGPFVAFELGRQFAPFGRIHDVDTFAALLDVEVCIGAKHSSLRRVPEWERLRLRDRRRPDFLVLTGNDLAIDMVMYGSDYLLGLATFAPDLFARRDSLWASGDPGFYELNDALQALGDFAFRPPVPAYRHSAAQFLHLRGQVDHDAVHPLADRRPRHDREVMVEMLGRLDTLAGA